VSLWPAPEPFLPSSLSLIRTALRFLLLGLGMRFLWTDLSDSHILYKETCLVDFANFVLCIAAHARTAWGSHSRWTAKMTPQEVLKRKISLFAVPVCSCEIGVRSQYVLARFIEGHTRMLTLDSRDACVDTFSHATQGSMRA